MIVLDFFDINDLCFKLSGMMSQDRCLPPDYGGQSSKDHCECSREVTTVQHDVIITSTPVTARLCPTKGQSTSPVETSGADTTLQPHDSGFSEIFSFLDYKEEKCQNSPRPPDCPTITSKTTPTSSCDDAGLSKMQRYFDQVYKQCDREQVIGKRIGQSYVDIIAGLYEKSIPCLSYIWSLLDDTDLDRCQNASAQWRSMLDENTDTKRRLSRVTKPTVEVEKENSSTVKLDREASVSEASRAPLVTVQLSVSSDDNSSDSVISDTDLVSSKFDRFVAEAKKLKSGEQFIKCPHCLGPALIYPVERRAKCRLVGCKFDFCTLCEMDFHGARKCHTQPNKRCHQDLTISSKRSRKHLKRL